MRSPIKTILAAGLIAGTLDISAAIIQYLIRGGKTPLIIFKYIASAVFGKERAYSGGTEMIFLGFLFHYAVAFSFSIIFFFLFPVLIRLISNKLILGGIYGLVVWMIMNLIIVPMTKIPAHPFDLNRSLIEALILVFCIGIPISIITAKYYQQKNKMNY